ncbi:MAG TPA: DUF748 domain-containing protein [Ramlibacter sp.]|nr:DUF748 domain-containing protein [Ramlibacter sp.]
MQFPSLKSRSTRWVAAALVLAALYTAGGFLLVPAVLRHQLPKLGDSLLARRLSVQEVRFNPYTLRLQADGLQLAEADGAPLLGLGQLVVELQWRSLLRRAWSFAEVRIGEPSASLVITKEGRFNLADAIATLQSRLGPSSDDAGLPRLVIERFVLERGRVHLDDRQAGYSNQLAPIDFALDDFSTLPDASDRHRLLAASVQGGKLFWNGSASLNPIRAQGEVRLEDVTLAGLSPYLQAYTHARVTQGRLSVVLPYTFSYANGRLQATLAGASLALRELAVGRSGTSEPFATLASVDVGPLAANLEQRTATIGQVHVRGGRLAVQRDDSGTLDLASLLKDQPAATPAAASAPAPTPAASAATPWKVAFDRIRLEDVALRARDQTASPPLQLDIGSLNTELRAALRQAPGGLQVTAADASMVLSDVSLASGDQAPIKLAKLGFAEGQLDLAARSVEVGRLYAEGGQLQLRRDAAGTLNVLKMLPPVANAPPVQASLPATSPAPWRVNAKKVDVRDLRAALEDQGSGIRLNVDDFKAELADAGSDMQRPLKFNAALRLREGGALAAQGSVVPATGALQSELRVAGLALAPLQPLLQQHVRLRIAGGEVAARGRLQVTGSAQGPRVRYQGSFGVARLALNEADGELFAGWKEVASDQLVLRLGERAGLSIPELRVVDANAKLIIEEDRSLNAARLLVRDAAAAAPASVQPAAAPAVPAQAIPAAGIAAAGSTPPAFPVRIARVRVRNATVDFADLSLRPQFGAKVEELQGVITGLSTDQEGRTQLELDGRVGEFGSARVRGELLPFAASDNTDVNVVFRNVDLAPVSPYSMKFAGYRIAGGKMSLDLQYKVRGRKLQGENRIVMDQLTLGERVDSPDALKLPLQLAIAILKDNEGRIDLGLPVSGDLDDPQFSYGAIVWKALGNLLTRVVSAPFRALGSALGLAGGEQLEGISFDPGSAHLLPPEREKLRQVAQLLARRSQLKLQVPGHFSEAADGAALRLLAVRTEVVRRAGVTLAEGESPGPVNLADRAQRKAVRELFTARFGAAELDRQAKAAEATPVAESGTTAAQALPLWQRAGRVLQGEPQVADSTQFYRLLLERLVRDQPLPPAALADLGTQRAAAIVAELRQAGVDVARAQAAAAAGVEGADGKPVLLKLGLGLP